jgi:DNA-binding NarL/FixJ family response regulator
MNKIRILVVDDHEVVRAGLKLSLELEHDMAVVGEASNGKEAVAQTVAMRPNVVLLDVRLEDMDGPEACRRILAAMPGTAVVMLTSYVQDAPLFRSLAAGAKGYLIKDVKLDDLKKMIRAVHRGDAVLDSKITASVMAKAAGKTAASAPALSDSDVTILRHLCAGLTNQRIAEHVHLSPHTIKDRIEKLCGIFGVRSRVALAAEAVKRDLV